MAYQPSYGDARHHLHNFYYLYQSRRTRSRATPSLRDRGLANYRPAKNTTLFRLPEKNFVRNIFRYAINGFIGTETNARELGIIRQIHGSKPLV